MHMLNMQKKEKEEKDENAVIFALSYLLFITDSLDCNSTNEQIWLNVPCFAKTYCPLVHSQSLSN